MALWTRAYECMNCGYKHFMTLGNKPKRIEPAFEFHLCARCPKEFEGMAQPPTLHLIKYWPVSEE